MPEKNLKQFIGYVKSEIDARLEQVDFGELRALQSRQDALSAQDMIHRVLLGAPPAA